MSELLALRARPANAVTLARAAAAAGVAALAVDSFAREAPTPPGTFSSAAT